MYKEKNKTNCHGNDGHELQQWHEDGLKEKIKQSIKKKSFLRENMEASSFQSLKNSIGKTFEHIHLQESQSGTKSYLQQITWWALFHSGSAANTKPTQQINWKGPTWTFLESGGQVWDLL